MKYVHCWNQSASDSAMQQNKQSKASTPNFNAAETPTMYNHNSNELDITSMLSVREKLSAAILGELVDKSFV